MAFSASPRKIMLLALFLQYTSTTAQNTTTMTNTTSSPDVCDSQNNHEIPANTSGSAQASNLYISVTLGDYRNETARSGAFIARRYGFLSVPKNSTVQACIYMFNAIPDVKEGDELNGCSGVLSTQCIDYLKRNWQLSKVTASVEAEPICPSFTTVSSDFQNTCGSSKLSGFISKPLNTTEPGCAYSFSPRNMNWDLPSGYETYPLFGGEVLPYDSEADNFSYYEIYAKQPIPFVITDINLGKSETNVVCVAPDKAMNGSHEVTETKNMGTQMEARSVAGITMFMALLVAVLLV